MIDVTDARKYVLENIKTAEVEWANLTELTGRILAEDIYSPIDSPPFNKSAMDGYAVKISSLSTASEKNPVKLKIIDTIKAGDNVSTKSGLFTTDNICVKIMTGAPVPQGFDAVVKIEDVDVEDNYAIFKSPASKMENIVKKGSDVRKDSVVMEKGRRIRAQEIGLLASLGIPRVRVFKKPEVAIISTGDELVEPGSPLEDGKIYNANSYILSSLIIGSGGIPHIMGIATDNYELIADIIEKSLKYDFVILSGGVSVGEYDYVKDYIDKNGQMFLWRVNMKPGKPFTFSVVRGTPVFGLPGNPVSSMVSFALFVKPALYKFQGYTGKTLPLVEAHLEDNYYKSDSREHYVRVWVEFKNGRFYAKPTKKKGSAILTTMTEANALARIPADYPEKTIVEKNTKVDILLVDPDFI